MSFSRRFRPPAIFMWLYFRLFEHYHSIYEQVSCLFYIYRINCMQFWKLVNRNNGRRASPHTAPSRQGKTDPNSNGQQFKRVAAAKKNQKHNQWDGGNI